MDGPPGCELHTYGRKPGGGGCLELDGQQITICAGIHTLAGCSTHADQKNLLDFIGRMRVKPLQVRVAHGEDDAKVKLAKLLSRRNPGIDVPVP